MPSLSSALLVGALLGVRHGFDADHLAAIDGLSRLHTTAGRPRLARLSGLLFSVGHGAVVIVAALALRTATWRVPTWLEGVGEALSVALLLFLGLANLLQAIFADRAQRPSPLAAVLLRASFARHALGSLLSGILFALSFDTFTIAAWFGTAAATGGGGAGPVALLTGAFVIGMIACDGLNGLWVAHLVRRSQGFASRARRIFSGSVAMVALAVAGTGILRLTEHAMGPWFDERGVWVSCVVVTFVWLGFLASRQLSAKTNRRGTEAP